MFCNFLEKKNSFCTAAFKPQQYIAIGVGDPDQHAFSPPGPEPLVRGTDPAPLVISGSAPKCYGSPTLTAIQLGKRWWWHSTVKLLHFLGRYFFLSFEYLILDLIKIFCQIRPFQAY
jgi:hypothetical protein